MNVLITGGAGYIGAHAAKAVSGIGWQPLVLDNLSTGHAENVRWGPLLDGDLSDRSLLRRVFEQHHIDAVLHFAASAYVGESMRFPRRYFQNNVAGTLNLLDAMLDHGVCRIVFSSTCAIYGAPKKLPLAEDHPQLPVNPYGESKLAIERMLRWLGDCERLSWVALRYFNAAGADPDGLVGEAHAPETHLLPLAILAAVGQGPPLSLYGTDYATRDGTAIRDYVHVQDLADAHVSALDYLLSGGTPMALNLGSGQGVSVREVLQAVAAVAGHAVPVVETGRRAGDPPVLIANPSRARAVLGWEPRRSDLATIVRDACSWHLREAGLNKTSWR